MNKFSIFVLSILSILILSSCKNQKDHKIIFNGDNAYNEVVELVRYSPRDAGTTNGHQAALHIYNKLISYGIDARLDYFNDYTPKGLKKMVNIIGEIPGSSREKIIIGSHFDTMPGIENYIGANDSGSSCGILLELSRMLAQTNLNYGIVFAFFDGEEGINNYSPGDGLHGSRYYSKKIQKSEFFQDYKYMILLDMVGDKDLNYTIPKNTSPILLKMLFKAAKKVNLEHTISSMPYTYIIDDHVPFLSINIPSINIIDFNYGTKKNSNEFWHTKYDNLDNISADSLEKTGILTLSLLNLIQVFE